MTKRYPHKPSVARRRQMDNRRSLLATRHRRHARFESLERRDLLTNGLNWDAEPFMATMLLEESPDDGRAAEVWADVDTKDSQFGLLRDPTFKALSAADAELLEADWGDDEPFMTTMFLEEPSDYVKFQYQWEDADFQDGGFGILGEPMLTAFSVFDAEVFESDWGDDQPFMTTMFLEDGDYGVLRASADDEALEEPVFRTLFTADEEVLATAWNEADALRFDDDSLDAEIMLLAATGPSPWQNLDNPEDVNADGWATPMDVLLIINGIGQDIALSPGLRLPVSLFLDVNGDRRLDASDAIQVINLLNGGDQTEPAADIASDQAPLWYEDRWAAPSVWEENEDSDRSVGETGKDAAEIDDTPWAVARVMQRDDQSEDLDQDDADEQLFSEDADWLLGELL